MSFSLQQRQKGRVTSSCISGRCPARHRERHSKKPCGQVKGAQPTLQVNSHQSDHPIPNTFPTSLLRFPTSSSLCFPDPAPVVQTRSPWDSPDLGGPGQPFGAGDAVTGGVLGRGRHHFIPFQGEGLSLQAVVIIVLLFLLAGIISFVRIPLVEGIEVILLDEGLQWGDREENIPKNQAQSLAVPSLMPLSPPCAPSGRVSAAAR